MKSIQVFVGLGSNLGHPIEQVRLGLAALRKIPDTVVTATSSLYGSAPLGGLDQPNYVNAVACLDTQLSPQQLLQALQGIEVAHGRVHAQEKWASRTLDLDLLLYGQQVIGEPGLTLPHPGLLERAFVVYPLLEISPDLVLPGGVYLSASTRHLSRSDLTLL